MHRPWSAGARLPPPAGEAGILPRGLKDGFEKAQARLAHSQNSDFPYYRQICPEVAHDAVVATHGGLSLDLCAVVYDI
jgi:hypothetical protein